MSKKFLEHFNGHQAGELRKLLSELPEQPRIAWYPSAGEDFRSLLYLSAQYSELNPGTQQPEPMPPDIFLFTDYYPWQHSRFLDSRTIFMDDRTYVYADYIEELPRLNLPLHEQLVHFPEGSSATDRALFLKIRIESNLLGTVSFPVLYAFAENETFFCRKIAPLNAKISHLIHVRYGGGCGGGGNASGIWLLNILKMVGCEVLISDGHYFWQIGDEFALSNCPEIPKTSDAVLTPYRMVESKKWSGHGNVTWNLVQ